MLLQITQWSRRRLLAALAGVAMLAACGGGGDSAGTAGASTFAEGPIEGFGSVIVGGVRFDDSNASIEDEDGVRHGSEMLTLGTMVEIDGGRVELRGNGRFCRALRIRFGAEIVGPVNSVDVAGSSLVVLGQPVDVTPTTVFARDLPGGLGGLQKDMIVAVHARFDAANGRYSATRIDARPNAPVFRLRGLVSQLDTTARTFQIGTEVISYAGIPAAELPNNLADGLKVRVRLEKVQENGQWIALSVRHGVRKFDDRDEAEIHGTVTAFESPTRFSVNGIKVNADNARFPDGPVALGDRVEVEGKAVDGVIIASKVEKDERRFDVLRFELHGVVRDLDTTAKTFVLRGVTVNYTGQTSFENGGEGNLANGAQIEVKGVLSIDRRLVVAVIVKFED